VCGGYDGITSLSTVERYDVKTDQWKKVAPMMRYRSAGGVSALRGFVYGENHSVTRLETHFPFTSALGGHDGLSIFDSVERYDPASDTWTKVKSMLSRRCRLGVATLNGKLYACGGYDGSSFLKSVECYDPNSDSWKIIAPMNVKRSRVALTANMGKLYGKNGSSPDVRSSETLDFSSNWWIRRRIKSQHGGGL
jgi:kelch-like protein 18